MTRLIRERAALDRVSTIGSTRFRPSGDREPCAAKAPCSLTREGLWDRALDGAEPKVAPRDGVVIRLILIVARLGFSLFITTGLAAGLGLYAGMNTASPNGIEACGAVFLWTLVLISCVTCRRS